jgi:hypothetical protein
MEKKMRYFLLILLFLAFLLSSFYLFLISQGYHISLSEKKIYQTGAIYLKVWPKEAMVFLDGKFKKRTDIIFGSLLLQNLKPRDYLLEVKKENFFPWKKRVRVNEKTVQEFREILLIPEKINFHFEKDNVLNIWPFSDKEIILQKKEDKTFGLYLFNFKEEKEKPLPFFKKLKNETEIEDLFFSKSENKIFLKTISDKTKYFAFDLEKDDFWQEITKEDFEKAKERKETIENKTFSLWQGNLFLEDLEGKKKIMENVNSFLVSPNKRKIAVFQDNEIWLLLKEDDFEKTFLTRFSKKIKNPFWINNNYLLFSLDDKIIVSETDTRDFLNYYEWQGFPDQKIIFNFSEKNFFVLSKGKLFLSEKIFAN